MPLPVPVGFDLASQVRRAVSSIALNAAEAQGNTGGNTRDQLESTLGSLYEARTGMRFAIAWGSQATADAVLTSLHRLAGWLFGVLRKSTPGPLALG